MTAKNDEYCRWMFTRVMAYINENKIQEAALSFLSDCDKEDINLGILHMLFINQTNKYDLIQLICGYSFMPSDLSIYYDNPEKAFLEIQNILKSKNV